MNTGSTTKDQNTGARRNAGPFDLETAVQTLDLIERLQMSLKKGPRCRDPQNCNGSCRRDPACNE